MPAWARSTEDYNSGKAAIGTGPYKFVEWVPGDRIILVANPDYFGGKPKFDKLTFKPIKAGPARISALLAGDVDFIDAVPPLDVARLKSDDSLQLEQRRFKSRDLSAYGPVPREFAAYHSEGWRPNQESADGCARS